MDAQIAAFLAQDGITTGAIYALLTLALELVFAVTRVIFIPQGEFVAYGALTLAMIQAGQAPATLWLLTVLGALVLALGYVLLAIPNGPLFAALGDAEPDGPAPATAASGAPTTDQRGSARVGNTDIGAFERRRIVDPVPDHRNLRFATQLADSGDLVLRHLLEEQPWAVPVRVLDGRPGVALLLRYAEPREEVGRLVARGARGQ